MTVLLVFLSASCSLAPDYFRPDAPEPVAYKELNPDWARAAPAADTPKGQWWLVFGDPMLTDLEAQIKDSNQDLQAAIARFEQARAAVEFARASLFPIVTANASAQRVHTSKNRPVSTALTRRQYNDYVAGLDANYEIDVFGRLRNAADAASDTAEASADDLQALNLSLQAELAADYFELRGDEALIRLYQASVKAYRQALDLTTQRFEGGVAGEIDLQEAKSQLNLALAAEADAILARAKLEHAIALLIGRPSSDYTLPTSEFLSQPPMIPAGLPSQLLQRRPDIAAAERRVATENAEIGVARAAYFPVFDLSASGGFESGMLGNFLKAPSQYWSFGPTAAATLLDVGQIDALNEEARARYDEAVADYRGTVLGAYREVEDQLASVTYYDQGALSQGTAVAAAERALELENDRYQGGVATFLDVVNSQIISLQSERDNVNLFVQQMNARVGLIKALGGVWGDHPDAPPLPVPAYDLCDIPQRLG